MIHAIRMAIQRFLSHVVSTFHRFAMLLSQLGSLGAKDGIANIYFPLVMQKPFLIIYFLPLLMFLSIALMNLVTAVLVDSWADFLIELDVQLFQDCQRIYKGFNCVVAQEASMLACG